MNLKTLFEKYLQLDTTAANYLEEVDNFLQISRAYMEQQEKEEENESNE